MFLGLWFLMDWQTPLNQPSSSPDGYWHLFIVLFCVVAKTPKGLTLIVVFCYNPFWGNHSTREQMHDWHQSICTLCSGMLADILDQENSVFPQNHITQQTPSLSRRPENGAKTKRLAFSQKPSPKQTSSKVSSVVLPWHVGPLFLPSERRKTKRETNCLVIFCKNKPKTYSLREREKERKVFSPFSFKKVKKKKKKTSLQNLLLNFSYLPGHGQGHIVIWPCYSPVNIAIKKKLCG